MSLALALFLQCQGQIKARHITAQETKQHELQTEKKQAAEDHRQFLLDYTADTLYHLHIPCNKLGLFLYRNFHLIDRETPIIWLELWYHHIYPPHLYTANLPHTGRRLPPPRKRTH